MRARMTTAAGLVASLLLAATAQAQAPQSFRVISPIFDQLVTFTMPTNFAVVFENTKGGHYMREAVLKGETPERWTQMITVTGEKGMTLTPGSSPQIFAGTIAGGFKSGLRAGDAALAKSEERAARATRPRSRSSVAAQSVQRRSPRSLIWSSEAAVKVGSGLLTTL